MFAHGAGGVHAWEIPIETFNIYVKVRFYLGQHQPRTKFNEY
jgi:hypothetical protein